MHSIHLTKKKVVPVEINGMECVAVLDNYSIDHFQRTNRKGLLKAFEEMKNENITSIMQLIGSLIREKKTNRILGVQYFKQFDFIGVIEHLSPVIQELVPENLPEPKEEKEKK